MSLNCNYSWEYSTEKLRRWFTSRVKSKTDSDVDSCCSEGRLKAHRAISQMSAVKFSVPARRKWCHISEKDKRISSAFWTAAALSANDTSFDIIWSCSVSTLCRRRQFVTVTKLRHFYLLQQTLKCIGAKAGNCTLMRFHKTQNCLLESKWC